MPHPAQALIAGLFPASCRVAVVVADDEMWRGYDSLYPEERVLGERAVEKRRGEIAAGRLAAREALRALGVEPGPIPRGEGRQAVWPGNVLGSISHCAGFCAVALALTRDARALGLDVEQAEPLKPELRRLICAPDESAALDQLGVAPAGSDWYKLAFSAKEAFYKAYYPHAKQVIDFLQARVRFEPAAQRFDVALIDDDAPSTVDGLRALAGRYECDGERVYCGVALPTRSATE